MSVIVRVGAIENDGEDFVMWLESPNSQPSRDITTLERHRAWPVATMVTPGAVVDLLHVVIRPEQAQDEALDAPLRARLLRELDTDEAAVALVVADPDGSHERYRYYVTQEPREQEDDLYGLHWVFTLMTADDTKWRPMAPTTVIWDVNTDGEQLAISNGGDAPVEPTYQVETVADRGEGWDWRFFVGVDPNTPGMAPDETPYDLTEAAWNTAALVTAGTITSADEIGVIVNGLEARRWIEGFNTANTRVWISLPFGATKETRLARGMGAGDVVTEIELHPSANDIRGWPAQGMLRIDNEMFTYTSKDVARRRFLGVTRAAKDTAAAAHADLAVARWIEHEIWIVYGGQTAATEFADGLTYDQRKPTIGLADSRNSVWKFNTWPTERAGTHRYPKWRAFETALGGAGLTGLVAPSAYSQLQLTREAGAIDPATGLPVAGTAADWMSYWMVTLPGYSVDRIDLKTTATRLGDGDWLVFIGETDDHAEALIELARPTHVSIPYLEILTWSGPQALARLYFAQYGTAAMEVNLDYWYITFSTEPGDGAQILRTTPRDNYSMALTLRNLTRDEAITLRAELALGDGLVVDGDTHEVKLLSDGSNQYQALERSAHRAELLPLGAGLNVLAVEEAGLEGVRIVITFEERRYS